MAVFSIADMSAAFSVPYRRKISQTQRKCPTLRLLAAIGALNRGNTGDTMRWTPKFSGQVAGNVNLDGGAFITAASDAPAAASLGYGTYEAPAKVTDDMLWRIGPGAGVPAEINTFSDVMMEARVDALQENLKLMNQQLFSGTGSSQQMSGLSVGVASSGAYAGITNSQWVSTFTSNSGTLRSLTLGLMKTLLRTVAAASKAGRPNLGICSPAIMDAIEGLFQPYLQIPAPMQAMPAGPSQERMVVNPGKIQTIGGTINMDGFRHFYWQTAGVYFVEDPDCTNTAETNTTAGIYFLNTNEIGLDFLPPPGPRMGAMDAQAVAAVEQDMGPLSGLEFESISRGRVDHSMQWDVTAKLGLKLLSRNAHGYLGDLQ